MSDDELAARLQSQQQYDFEVEQHFNRELRVAPPHANPLTGETEDAGEDVEAAMEGQAIQALGPREQVHGSLVYYPWKDTVDFDAIAGDDTPAKSIIPPYLSRLKRPVNVLSTQAIVELVERFMMPEGRLAPVKIYNGAGESMGFLSLYRFARTGGKQSKKRKLSGGGAGPASKEEDPEPPDGSTLVSGYSQFNPPQGSIAEQELASFHTAFEAWATSKGNTEKKSLTKSLNVAHICWRYFHRMGSNEPMQLSPERYLQLMQYAQGNRETWDRVSDADFHPDLLCRRLPLGLSVSHQASAYDTFDWNRERDIHPSFRQAYNLHTKRRAKGAKDIEWGSNDGYKLEMSECEDILQQSMRKSCAELGLMYKCATTGQLINNFSNQPTQCPHAVHGFPCYGPPAPAFRNDWPNRSSLRNSTTRSQIRETRGALATTAHQRPSGGAANVPLPADVGSQQKQQS